MKKVAILQSNYIPWKGYFDIINSVDVFIFHDDLQYTKNDWRNRNKIKTKSGLSWLTVPVGSSEKRLICDVKINDHSWQKKHWAQIQQNYSKAPYFKDYKDFFEQFFLDSRWHNLSEMNQHLIKIISTDFLGISTQFEDSRTYALTQKKDARVLELLNKVNCTKYLSGPAAKSYIDVQDFFQSGIEVEWMDYSGYKIYEQCNPPFEHSVSIIDLLFHVGEDYKNYMISFS